MLSVLALSWLGLFGGCQSFSSGCGSGCGAAGCGAGGCGAGGCGAGGCGAGCGIGSRLGDGTCLQHGICDCDIDDHCLTRSPWVRYAPVALGIPVQPLPVEPLPVPPKELPKGKL